MSFATPLFMGGKTMRKIADKHLFSVAINEEGTNTGQFSITVPKELPYTVRALRFTFGYHNEISVVQTMRILILHQQEGDTYLGEDILTVHGATTFAPEKAVMMHDVFTADGAGSSSAIGSRVIQSASQRRLMSGDTLVCIFRHSSSEVGNAFLLSGVIQWINLV